MGGRESHHEIPEYLSLEMDNILVTALATLFVAATPSHPF